MLRWKAIKGLLSFSCFSSLHYQGENYENIIIGNITRLVTKSGPTIKLWYSGDIFCWVSGTQKRAVITLLIFVWWKYFLKRNLQGGFTFCADSTSDTYKRRNYNKKWSAYGR